MFHEIYKIQSTQRTLISTGEFTHELPGFCLNSHELPGLCLPGRVGSIDVVASQMRSFRQLDGDVVRITDKEMSLNSVFTVCSTAAASAVVAGGWADKFDTPQA